ncbi:tyrosine-type recombinase/integrase [Endozoicomonas ascidiicola]|uniref:tyrosine-type recombinase/integrase n=1 Tax=Endozoicomonas ascidiicola TaxID=1698521 RepID=UPI000832C2C4|nr:integrase family protein [Endozoicomonas ascidiicola]
MAESVFLTDASIRKMKRPKQLKETRDSSGLVLRHFTDGAKVFGWRFVDHHAGGKRQRIEYGSYPFLSLEKARLVHGLMVAARKEGKDIMSNAVRAIVLKEALGDDAPEIEQEGMTLSLLYKKYMDNFVEPNKIGPRPYRRIKNHIIPVLGNEVVDAIPRSKMKQFMIDFRSNNSEITVADTIRFAVTMCNYGKKNFWIDSNPFSELDVKRKNTKRKVYYTMEEIRTLLLNSDQIKLSKDYQLIHKATLLSGCRIGEVIDAEIREFDFEGGLWTIPPERLKNQKRLDQAEKEPLELPMSQQLEDTIREAIKEFGNDTHVFGSKKNEFIDGRWQQRGKIGSSSQRNYRQYINPYREHYGVRHKTNHDLRRTIETTLNNLGVPSDITTAMTGHSKKGIKGVYNHGRQLHALRAGFQMYADFIDFLCERDVVYCRLFKAQKVSPEFKEILKTFNFHDYLLAGFDFE